MIIKNIHSYTQNNISLLKGSSNILNAQHSSKSINNNKLFTPNKINTNSQNQKDVINKKIELLLYKLRASQLSESEAQSGMFFLQQKEICLEKIHGAGNELNELSKQYKNSNLTKEDKEKIEKQAEKLLKGIDKLMNNKKSGDNDLMDCKSISIKDSNGQTNIILSESFNITLEPVKLEDVKLSCTDKVDILDDTHFKSKVSTKTLLENTSIIEEKLLKPVQKAIEDVDSAKSDIFDKFTCAYSSATASINELFESGKLSEYIKIQQLDIQKSLYFCISSLRAQSLNINRDNVYELLE